MELPIIFENKPVKENATKIVDYINNNQSDFGELTGGYWNGRTIHIPQIKDPSIVDIIKEGKNFMLDEFKKICNIDKYNIATYNKPFPCVLYLTAPEKGNWPFVSTKHNALETQCDKPQNDSHFALRNYNLAEKLIWPLYFFPSIRQNHSETTALNS